MQIFKPQKSREVRWYLQPQEQHSGEKWDCFISTRAGGKALGSTYRREIILLKKKKSKDLQSTRFEKYKCMDYLSSHLVFYCSSPRLSPGVLSMMQHTNALPCSEQEKALWMSSRFNPVLGLDFTFKQNSSKWK